MIKTALMLLLSFCTLLTDAQNIGIGTTSPEASAALEIKANDKGLLVPRTSTTTRMSIISPAKGLMLYDTTSNHFWYYDGSAWAQIGTSSANGWSLNGNAGTNASNNFIGTTDMQPLVFKLNNIRAGVLDYDAFKANTSVGYQTLFFNLNGSGNTAVGYKTLYSNTTGSGNTAQGSSALYFNTAGSGNTAYGGSALYANATGSGNVAFGASTLYANTTGYYNTANGFSASYSNTTGNYNTATGNNALYSNATGNNNTANGNNALYLNTTGEFNTADGDASLYNNVTGSGNVGIGYFADVASDNLSNATAIGFNAIVDANNKMRFGNGNVVSIGGQVGWTSFSDGRYKTNVKQNVHGLDFINSLQPVTYSIDVNRLNAYYGIGGKSDSVRRKANSFMNASANGASNIIYSGFIAQDVEKAAEKLGYDFSGVDKPQTQNGLYGLRYADFVVPLVKAVQEQQAIINEQNHKIDMLIKEIQLIKRKIK